jgi:site-specific DNA-methyltransferase (adenine-specific)
MDNYTLKHIARATKEALGCFPCVIVQADALKFINHLDLDSIDLTVTDPPYESLERHRAIGTTTRLSQSKGSTNEWFDVISNVDLVAFLAKVYRLHKPNTHLYCFTDSETEHVLLTGQNPYANASASVPESPVTTYGWRAWPTLDYIKVNRRVPKTLSTYLYATLTDEKLPEEQRIATVMDTLTRKGTGWHWRKSSERIVFLEKGKRKLNNAGFGNVHYGPAPAPGNSAQKPLAVIKRLIENASQPGELVFDPFGGFGTVAQAAIELKRRVLIIETNPARCHDIFAIKCLEHRSAFINEHGSFTRDSDCAIAG